MRTSNKRIDSIVRRTLMEAVNKKRGVLREYDEDKFPDWTRKEPRIDDDKLATLADELKAEIANIGDDEDKAFEVVRKLGMINASTLKKHPSVKGKPRALPDDEHAHDKMVYTIKDEILPMLVDIYVKNGWDISVDMAKASEKYGASVFFRNLSSQIQNSFHGFKGDYSKITKNGEWDGVMNAYRYGNNATDPKYSPKAYGKQRTTNSINKSLKDYDKEKEIERWHMGESRRRLNRIISEAIQRTVDRKKRRR